MTNTIFEHHKFTIEEIFYILKGMKHKSTSEISKELRRKDNSILDFIREVKEVAEKIEESVRLKIS